MPDSRAMSDAAVPAWIEAAVGLVGMIGSSVTSLVVWSYRMADRLRLRDEAQGKALNDATQTMRDKFDGVVGAFTAQIQGIAKESREDRERLREEVKRLISDAVMQQTSLHTENRADHRALVSRVGELERLVAKIEGAVSGLSSSIKRTIGP